ncbi:hypothetical protein HQN90_16055 [Paenibacillus alba]|uniref:nicotianamine synthase family protein n=1 Tax=Paenibacillus alba TaxID=1197127 RepID=UPI001567C49C|nr:hypothetical protein [Paenibacillus alba]
MRGSDEFAYALHRMNEDIKHSASRLEACSNCFEILKDKLDRLCDFITSIENVRQWSLWNHEPNVQEQSRMLRTTAVKALCDLEKYQSRRIHNEETQISEYMQKLSHSVRADVTCMQVTEQSKVVFIGSGALPLSALTIAQESGAEVICLDIDLEAVELGRHTAAMSGLGSRVAFSHKRISELAVAREATHFIIASLVENKLEILEELKHAAHHQAKILIRYGNGLKSLFNFPLEADLSEDWTLDTLRTQGHLYDTIILERAIQLKGV